MLAPSYEEGLENLKKLIEGMPAPQPAPEVIEVDSVSVEEEMVEKFGDLWELLDLDLKDVFDLGSKGSSEGNLAPSEESTGGL